MKTNTKAKILQLARERGGIRPSELIQILEISNTAVHQHLRHLVASGKLGKKGRPPTVLYVALETDSVEPPLELPHDLADLLEQHYCYFSPTGKELIGIQGFTSFLNRTNQANDVLARASEYRNILKKAEAFRDRSGLIEGTAKLLDTFPQSFIDRLYYSDFYSLPKYGKTRLGHYLLHGKSGQNRNLIKTVASKTKSDVDWILRHHRIDAVAFAPHSIPRQIPFLKIYRRQLAIDLPEIMLSKAYSGEVPIAQKSLSKLSERIENARETIFVLGEYERYKRILIIDDALGSGATMNEIGRKLSHPTRKVFAYAIVGSYKGFEVIKEV